MTRCFVIFVLAVSVEMSIISPVLKKKLVGFLAVMGNKYLQDRLQILLRSWTIFEIFVCMGMCICLR